MGYELIKNIVFVFYYTGFVIWIILVSILIWQIIKRKRSGILRAIKYLINSVIILMGWGFILELALVVKPPILNNKETSVNALNTLIKNHQLNDLHLGIGIPLILLGINLLFYFFAEKRAHKKDIFILSFFSIFVVTFSIWLTGKYAWYGLMQEINRHFG